MGYRAAVAVAAASTFLPGCGRKESQPPKESSAGAPTTQVSQSPSSATRPSNAEEFHKWAAEKATSDYRRWWSERPASTYEEWKNGRPPSTYEEWKSTLPKSAYQPDAARGDAAARERRASKSSHPFLNGRFGEAVLRCEEELREAPQSRTAHHNLAMAILFKEAESGDAKNIQRAIGLLAEAQKLQPDRQVTDNQLQGALQFARLVEAKNAQKK